MAAIELDGVTKRYDSVTAIRDLSLQVEDGEIYGFLGPNGSGKSTTINILLDFVRPTDGTAKVFGIDCQEDPLAVRQRIGVLPEGFGVYDRLTGRQHVQFACESKAVDADPEALLDRVGLVDSANRRASDYSKGMKQRLILAMALAGDPDLLILDEPTTGLDPNGARRMRELIEAERDRGATVFFSSHILAQVDAVCDRVGILTNGELTAQDSIDALRASTDSTDTLRITVAQPDGRALEAVRSLAGVSNVSTDGNTMLVDCADASKTAVISAVEEAGVEVTDFSTEEASLEELFEQFTTEGSR
jgi:ABC-2 type transport system ATP-binding protein